MSQEETKDERIERIMKEASETCQREFARYAAMRIEGARKFAALMRAAKEGDVS